MMFEAVFSKNERILTWDTNWLWNSFGFHSEFFKNSDAICFNLSSWNFIREEVGSRILWCSGEKLLRCIQTWGIVLLSEWYNSVVSIVFQILSTVKESIESRTYVKTSQSEELKQHCSITLATALVPKSGVHSYTNLYFLNDGKSKLYWLFEFH